MNTDWPEVCDAVVVGGGFFGCSLALLLRARGLRPIVIEREEGLLQRASYHNQARVHHGYHYPRSLMTAVRSRVNYPRFCEDYADCIVGTHEKYYAVGRVLGKVSAAQFELFMKRVGAPLKPAPKEVRRRFHPEWIEAVWCAEEVAFDAARLREMVRVRLGRAGIPVFLGMEAEAVERSPSGNELRVRVRGGDRIFQVRTPWLFNCTYSGLNRLRVRSGLAPLALKHECTEMALIEPPESLRHWAVTVMCGPFFSLMPFPDRKLCTLSHVRHTPHFAWEDGAAGGVATRDPYEVLAQSPKESAGTLMLRDAARFLPELAGARQMDSLWEIKTLLPQSELDDGRPILFEADSEVPGLVSILGGKIDNIYDLPEELDGLGLIG
jgi:glycine/D-amino acid oxidase-like deaminating enzyme